MKRSSTSSLLAEVVTSDLEICNMFFALPSIYTQENDVLFLVHKRKANMNQNAYHYFNQLPVY
jgi:hypothetical protein